MRFVCLVVLALAPIVRADDVDYVRDVRPILQAKCAACHGAIRQKSGLRLDAAQLALKGAKRGPVIVPGKADESPLIEAVIGKDRPRMPPEGEGEHLSAKDIATLRTWIDQGAKAPDEPVPADPKSHWAYQPIRKPEVPNPKSEIRNPIDAFLAAEWEKRNLKPNPPADKATLLRRVYLDLIGLPPTRDELHAFLKDDSPNAFETVVDKLLASPAYGERWGRHWMDVWRYSDPFGFNDEYRYSQRHIWRWRDWIIESLNADKGYDRMIVEMLAGDEVAPTDRDTLRATGYLARNWYKFNRTAWIQDTTEYTAAGFLGVTLRCARCHDHKYDPIAQKDYYQFRAFFEPHDIRLDALPGQPDTTKDGVARAFDGKADAPTYLFVRGDERMPDKSRTLSPGVPGVLGGELAVRAVKFSTKDFAATLPSVAAELRRLAKVELDAAPSEMRRATVRATLAAIEARLAAEQAKFADAADAKTLALAAGKAERRVAMLKAEENLAATVGLSRMVVKKTLATATAAAEKDDPTYTPLVKMDPAGSTGRRLALAKWITDKRNPLTARVAVNHIWLRHFGKPLVASVANFGLSGQKPTHPELLDWLAAEFMESGWSMKKLHKLIVTSAAYRLSSVPRSELRAPSSNDVENRYYTRANLRRMEAEVVRDSVLAVAGQLDRTTGGPILSEKLGQSVFRRSVYFRFNAEYKMLFLDQFDAASPTECYERRESVIPQQALALHNSALSLNMSRHLAKQLATEEAFLTAAFETVLGRAPTADERTRCETFLREQTELFKDAKKLTAFPPSPDTVTPPSTDPLQRAREDLIHVLLNHNDFVTIR